MGTLTVRNCTVWDVHYWRQGGNSKAVVSPGEEGTYDWGTTYTLGVKRENVSPEGKHYRHGVNQSGTYYIVWNSAKEELDTLSETDASVYPRSPNNKYLAKWFVDHSKWMADLDASLTLDKFSIPGTHDSGTEKIAEGYAHTQNFNIATQLEDGIRFLDIRVSPQNNSGDPLKIKHGDYSCKISFADVLNSCSRFLTVNTNETIIMLVDSSSGSNKGIEAGFRAYLEQDQYKDLFLLEGKIPTLETARGKIVLFRRFEIEGSEVLGVNLSKGWKSNETFSLTTPDGDQFEIEDEYKEHDTHKKVKIVHDCLNLASETPDHSTMYLTYNSIATNGFHTPYQYAWGGNGVDPAMNKSLDYLHTNSKKRRLGVVLMDFYNNKGSDNENVVSIIESNFDFV